MEVSGDLIPVFGANLIQLDGVRLKQLKNDEILRAIDQLGSLSASFAHSRYQLTSVAKLINNPDQKLYLYWEFDRSASRLI